jgi:hypothetical protein
MNLAGLSLLGEGRLDHTEPMVFSASDTCDVGNDFGSPVTDDYPAVVKSSPELNWAVIDVDKNSSIFIASSRQQRPNTARRNWQHSG